MNSINYSTTIKFFLHEGIFGEILNQNAGLSTDNISLAVKIFENIFGYNPKKQYILCINVFLEKFRVMGF